MPLVLTLKDSSAKTWSVEILPQPQVLGRATSAEIRINHQTVSKQHCRFWYDAEATWVEDCGSSNGTFVNGERVQKSALAKGDRILVGSIEMVVGASSQLIPTDMFVPPDSDTSPPEPHTDSQQLAPAKQDTEERDLAVAVHQRLTPSRRLSLPGLLIEVAYRPSGLLGGDCFECFELVEGWLLGLFDPMNHGTKAALTMMLLRSELRRWAGFSTDPSQCLEWINRELTSLRINDLYISGSLAVWSPSEKTLSYSTAGLHRPLLSRDGDVFHPGDTADSLPLGILADERFEKHTIELQVHDRVFFFTDGAAVLGRGQNMSPAGQRITDELRGYGGTSLQAQVQQVFDGTHDELLDDALLVGCEAIE